MTVKRILFTLVFLALLGSLTIAGTIYYYSQNLPDMITLDDFKPLLVSEVYDRNDKKIGEFFRERRKITKTEDIPDIVKKAFISSEDSSFYEHKGVNITAIIRAMIVNIKAGRKVQGGSTITQQVAKRIVLKDKAKKYSRKIKEAILARRMEENLSKDQIMYLYLNEIYFGQGAYGVAMASEVYFRKPLREITIPEAALLAGLPQAPSRYTPVYKPKAAKNRQTYVLNRMAAEGYITKDQANKAINEDLKVYTKINYEEKAPYFLETIRQTLVKHVTEKALLDEGLKIYTGLDIDRQIAAQKRVRLGLEELDKRQGYRGAINNITDAKQVSEFLLKTRDKLILEFSPLKVIKPDGTIRKKTKLNLTGKDEQGNKLPNIPKYINKGDIVKAVVTNVNDKLGLTTVRFAENKGLIDVETMMWARKPDPKVSKKWAKNVRKPSEALKKGDIILVKVVGENFNPKRLSKVIANAKSKDEWPKNIPNFSDYAEVHLEQEPKAQGALLSIGNNSGDILAMVGGYDFKKSKYNCSIQAARQTGSSFKAFVYAAALDHGYTPASILIDAPLVYKQSKTNWKPSNYSNKFKGDILFRSSLAQSLNIPTIKLIEDLGVTWVADYTKRLGIFSPLNMDYTLALGSSSVTLYEMTKAFAHFPRLGKKVSPTLIHKVENQQGEVVLEKLSLDDRFSEEINDVEEYLLARKKVGFSVKSEDLEDPNATNKSDGSNEEIDEKEKEVTYTPQLFFNDPDQLMKPTTAFLTTTILKAAITDPNSTGLRASNLGRPAAGKTGTTNDEYDAWFIGYTPQITTGVWVGYLSEQSLGAGEGGGKTALPIWLEYMKDAHENMEKQDFKVPGGIMFANIDNISGRLSSADSDPETVIKQAFVIGTEPTGRADEPTVEETKNFYKDDLADE